MAIPINRNETNWGSKEYLFGVKYIAIAIMSPNNQQPASIYTLNTYYALYNQNPEAKW